MIFVDDLHQRTHCVLTGSETQSTPIEGVIAPFQRFGRESGRLLAVRGRKVSSLDRVFSGGKRRPRQGSWGLQTSPCSRKGRRDVSLYFDCNRYHETLEKWPFRQGEPDEAFTDVQVSGSGPFSSRKHGDSPIGRTVGMKLPQLIVK